MPRGVSSATPHSSTAGQICSMISGSQVTVTPSSLAFSTTRVMESRISGISVDSSAIARSMLTCCTSDTMNAKCQSRIGFARMDTSTLETGPHSGSLASFFCIRSISLPDSAFSIVSRRS